MPLSDPNTFGYICGIYFSKHLCQQNPNEQIFSESKYTNYISVAQVN